MPALRARKCMKACRAPKTTSTIYQRRWADLQSIGIMKKNISATPIYNHAEISNSRETDTRHADEPTSI